MAGLASSDWNPLHDKNYRKAEVYTMLWGQDFSLEESIVVGAPFGGPIALVRDIRKSATSKSSGSGGSGGSTQKVRIFTSAGKAISEFSLEKESLKNFVSMGWTESENLIIVMVYVIRTPHLILTSPSPTPPASLPSPPFHLAQSYSALPIRLLLFCCGVNCTDNVLRAVTVLFTLTRFTANALTRFRWARDVKRKVWRRQ